MCTHVRVCVHACMCACVRVCGGCHSDDGIPGVEISVKAGSHEVLLLYGDSAHGLYGWKMRCVGTWQDMGPERQAGSRLGEAPGPGWCGGGLDERLLCWKVAGPGTGLNQTGYRVKDRYASSQIFFCSRNMAVVAGGPWEQVGMTLKLCEACKLT